MAIAKKVKFSLPNEKVTIEIVNRPRGPIKDPKHEAFQLYGNATIDVCVPQDRQGNLIDPLTVDEREFFEDRSRSGMPFDVGELSVHNKKNENYWYTVLIKLDKNKRILDLSNPKDYLDYKVLLANRELIAPSGEEQMNKVTYRFAIIRADYMEKTTLSEADSNERAWTKFGEIRNDRSTMSNILKNYGRSAGEDATDDFLRTEITKLIKNDIKRFLEVAEDKLLEDKIFIHKAVRAGAIKIVHGKYELPGGDKLAEKSEVANMVNAIAFIKQPENQEIYANIKERVDISDGK
jgi:hypothetical protein|tara:strand:+ start:8646 stop:9524 length:879 start_codon:yes stop_codon:yes gene_type:complete